MYYIEYSEDARNDMKELSYTIVYLYKAPLTAERYMRGLERVIKSLCRVAESLPIQKRAYFQQYGPNVRRINYKKMTVIYTVHGDLVYIRRIVPANTITDL